MADIDLSSFDPKKLSPTEFRDIIAGVGDGSGIDLGELDPQVYARLVGRASNAQLNELMNSPVRSRIVAEVVQRMVERFRPDKAGKTTAVIHWEVTGAPGGGSDRHEVVVENGACSVSESVGREPRTTIVLAGPEFLKLTSGNGNPVTMFIMRKLTVRGDVSLAANLSNMFDIPKA